MGDIKRIGGSNLFGTESVGPVDVESSIRRILTGTQGSAKEQQLRALLMQMSPQEARDLQNRLANPNDYLSMLVRNLFNRIEYANFQAGLNARAAGLPMPPLMVPAPMPPTPPVPTPPGPNPPGPTPPGPTPPGPTPPGPTPPGPTPPGPTPPGPTPPGPTPPGPTPPGPTPPGPTPPGPTPPGPTPPGPTPPGPTPPGPTPPGPNPPGPNPPGPGPTPRQQQQIDDILLALGRGSLPLASDVEAVRTFLRGLSGSVLDLQLELINDLLASPDSSDQLAAYAALVRSGKVPNVTLVAEAVQARSQKKQIMLAALQKAKEVGISLADQAALEGILLSLDEPALKDEARLVERICTLPLAKDGLKAYLLVHSGGPSKFSLRLITLITLGSAMASTISAQELATIAATIGGMSAADLRALNDRVSSPTLRTDEAAISELRRAVAARAAAQAGVLGAEDARKLDDVLKTFDGPALNTQIDLLSRLSKSADSQLLLKAYLSLSAQPAELTFEKIQARAEQIRNQGQNQPKSVAERTADLLKSLNAAGLSASDQNRIQAILSTLSPAAAGSELALLEELAALPRAARALGAYLALDQKRQEKPDRFPPMLVRAVAIGAGIPNNITDSELADFPARMASMPDGVRASLMERLGAPGQLIDSEQIKIVRTVRTALAAAQAAFLTPEETGQLDRVLSAFSPLAFQSQIELLEQLIASDDASILIPVYLQMSGNPANLTLEKVRQQAAPDLQRAAQLRPVLDKAKAAGLSPSEVTGLGQMLQSLAPDLFTSETSFVQSLCALPGAANGLRVYMAAFSQRGDNPKVFTTPLVQTLCNAAGNLTPVLTTSEFNLLAGPYLKLATDPAKLAADKLPAALSSLVASAKAAAPALDAALKAGLAPADAGDLISLLSGPNQVIDTAAILEIAKLAEPLNGITVYTIAALRRDHPVKAYTNQVVRLLGVGAGTKGMLSVTEFQQALFGLDNMLDDQDIAALQAKLSNPAGQTDAAQIDFIKVFCTAQQASNAADLDPAARVELRNVLLGFRDSTVRASQLQLVSKLAVDPYAPALVRAYIAAAKQPNAPVPTEESIRLQSATSAIGDVLVALQPKLAGNPDLLNSLRFVLGRYNAADRERELALIRTITTMPNPAQGVTNYLNLDSVRAQFPKRVTPEIARDLVLTGASQDSVGSEEVTGILRAILGMNDATFDAVSQELAKNAGKIDAKRFALLRFIGMRSQWITTDHAQFPAINGIGLQSIRDFNAQLDAKGGTVEQVKALFDLAVANDKAALKTITDLDASLKRRGIDGGQAESLLIPLTFLRGPEFDREVAAIRGFIQSNSPFIDDNGREVPSPGLDQNLKDIVDLYSVLLQSRMRGEKLPSPEDAKAQVEIASALAGFLRPGDRTAIMAALGQVTRSLTAMKPEDRTRDLLMLAQAKGAANPAAALNTYTVLAGATDNLGPRFTPAVFQGLVIAGGALRTDGTPAIPDLAAVIRALKAIPEDSFVTFNAMLMNPRPGSGLDGADPERKADALKMLSLYRDWFTTPSGAMMPESTRKAAIARMASEFNTASPDFDAIEKKMKADLDADRAKVEAKLAAIPQANRLSAETLASIKSTAAALRGDDAIRFLDGVSARVGDRRADEAVRVLLAIAGSGLNREISDRLASAAGNAITTPDVAAQIGLYLSGLKSGTGIELVKGLMMPGDGDREVQARLLTDLLNSQHPAEGLSAFAMLTSLQPVPSVDLINKLSRSVGAGTLTIGEAAGMATRLAKAAPADVEAEKAILEAALKDSASPEAAVYPAFASLPDVPLAFIRRLIDNARQRRVDKRTMSAVAAGLANYPAEARPQALAKVERLLDDPNTKQMLMVFGVATYNAARFAPELFETLLFTRDNRIAMPNWQPEADGTVGMTPNAAVKAAMVLQTLDSAQEYSRLKKAIDNVRGGSAEKNLILKAIALSSTDLTSDSEYTRSSAIERIEKFASGDVTSRTLMETFEPQLGMVAMELQISADDSIIQTLRKFMQPPTQQGTNTLIGLFSSDDKYIAIRNFAGMLERVSTSDVGNGRLSLNTLDLIAKASVRWRAFRAIGDAQIRPQPFVANNNALMDRLLNMPPNEFGLVLACLNDAGSENEKLAILGRVSQMPLEFDPPGGLQNEQHYRGRQDWLYSLVGYCSTIKGRSDEEIRIWPFEFKNKPGNSVLPNAQPVDPFNPPAPEPEQLL